MDADEPQPRDDTQDTLPLASILDVGTAQSLLEGFSEATGMTSAILDLSGEILAAAGWHEACTRFHRVHPTTARRCTESDTHLRGRGCDGTFEAYKCLNGLWDVSAPFCIGDTQYGWAFVGQFFYEDEPLDMDFFRNQAEACDFDKEDYLAAIEAIPRYSRQHVDSLMRHLLNVVQSLSASSLGVLRLNQAVADAHVAMRALKESEERFSRIVSNSMAGYFFIDRDGYFRDVNHAWLSIHGYESQDEVIGQHYSLTQVEEDLPASTKIVEAVMAGRPVPEREFSHKCRDGSIGYHLFTLSQVLEGDECVGFEGFLIDTTESRAAEEDYHRLFREMLDGFATHEIICDDQGTPVDYRFLAVNPAFERMTGLNGADIVGRRVREVLPDIEPQWIDTYGTVALTGVPAHFENYAAPLDKHFEVTAYQPSPGQFACIFSDVTERKRAEAEILRLNKDLRKYSETLEVRVVERTEELEEANQSLESFVYSVSHDLRAPLRAISGFSEILSRRHRDDLNDEGRHYLDNILEATESMGHLITDLLAYSRLGKAAVSREPIELSPLIDEVVAELEPKRLESGSEVAVASVLPPVQADRSLLRQVLTNLTDNAFTYRRPGIEHRVAIGAERVGDSVFLKVSDNGVGIEPRYHGKIFDIFQRLQKQDDYPGTGIGLAVVKKSVELMDGSVWVESLPGEGSTFWVKLPAADNRPAHIREGGS